MINYNKYNIWGFNSAFSVAYAHHGMTRLTMVEFDNWMSKSGKRFELSFNDVSSEEPLRLVINMFHAVLTNKYCNRTGMIVWFKQHRNEYEGNIRELDIIKIENFDPLVRRNNNYIINELKKQLINNKPKKLSIDFELIKTKINSNIQYNKEVKKEIIVRQYAKYKGINSVMRSKYNLLNGDLSYKHSFDSRLLKLVPSLYPNEPVVDKIEHYSFHNRISYMMSLDMMCDVELIYTECSRYAKSTIDFVKSVVKGKKWRMVELIIDYNNELHRFLTMINPITLCELIDGLHLNTSDIVVTGKNNKKILDPNFYYLLLEASEQLDMEEGIYG